MKLTIQAGISMDVDIDFVDGPTGATITSREEGNETLKAMVGKTIKAVTIGDSFGNITIETE